MNLSKSNSELLIGQRQFTLQNQKEFAKLSGDFNPIHVDPIRSRRYMFGQPIVHGLHSILWALDAWCKIKKTQIKILSLKVSFPKPIFLNSIVECFIVANNPNSVEIEIRSKLFVCAKLFIKFEELSFNGQNTKFSNLVVDDYPKRQLSKNLVIDELQGRTGILGLFLKKAEAIRFFPFLSKSICSPQIAFIISITRLVGVECPGLNSLFSAFELLFKDNQKKNLTLNYLVSKIDKRFGLIYIKLNGDSISGTIKAFMRPVPVPQLDYNTIKNQVDPNEFVGQKALIIGGSRGLGEVSAKILAAGGASVIITYNKGIEEAKRVVNEITSLNGRVDMMHYDVFTSPANLVLNEKAIPTHCYYFATPFIFSGNRGLFSDKLFSQFCSYYVTGVDNIIRFLHSKGTNNFLYPSTIAIDELSDNMIEYSLAKVAGEKLCQFLLKIYPLLKIYNPKLPRIATDQTVSLLPADNKNPMLLMLEHLRTFQLLT